MMFPAPVPEIPAANVDDSAAYYVNALGFTLDWGDDQGFWLNLYSKAEVDRLFAQWKAARANSLPSPRTNRGSCASSWPPIVMAT